MPVFSDFDGVPLELEGSPIELAPGRGDLRFSSIPITDGPFLFDRPVSYAEIYATQHWVAIAVDRLLTWSVRVPLKVYRRLGDDGERRRLRPDEHPLARAVAAPWDRGSMAALVTNMLGPLLVHGNSLTDVDEGAGGKIRFKPTDWRRVAPIRPFGDDIVGWRVYDTQGASEPRSADTMLHLRWWSPLGPLGISPLRKLGATIAIEKAAIEWTLTNLRNAARPGGVVQLGEQFLSLEPAKRQALYDQARDDMRAAFSGPSKAGMLPVLPPGFDWKTAEHTTAVEAQLIEQRNVDRNEVSSVYMIPPPMIGILDDATYANITTQREMGYTDGLAPPLILTEQSINAHVCAGMLREDDIFVEFDFAGILRGDRLKEIKAHREAISMMLETPNEGRDALNLTRSTAPGADSLWAPRNNLAPIDAPEEARA